MTTTEFGEIDWVGEVRRNQEREKQKNTEAHHLGIAAHVLDQLADSIERGATDFSLSDILLATDSATYAEAALTIRTAVGLIEAEEATRILGADVSRSSGEFAASRITLNSAKITPVPDQE